jgi:hypothetical protein
LRCCPRSGWVAAMLAWERADFYFNGKVNWRSCHHLNVMG